MRPLPKKIKVVQPITISLDTSSSDSDSNTDLVEMLNETVLTHENPTSVVEGMLLITVFLMNIINYYDTNNFFIVTLDHTSQTVKQIHRMYSDH